MSTEPPACGSTTIPLRVLILEDSPADATLMLHALRAAGYNPIASRVETEESFRAQLQPVPEILLADFSMPEFDALRALEIIRELKVDMPVIIVSVAIGEERAVQVMQRGATDYVIKDRMGRLGHAVTQALEQKRLRDAKVRAENALLESEVQVKKAQKVREQEQEARIRAEHDNRVLQAANKRKDDLLAMLGHELRNPLAPIRTAAHVLQQALKDDPRLKQACEIIQRQSQHMTRIIEDLLDVSRMTLGKNVLRKELLDFTDLVQRASDDYRDEIETSGTTLTMGKRPDPLWILADPTRICQVVGNLLTNAKKFSADGGKISVQCAATLDSKWAELTVSDSGIGMTEETIASVFEPFNQVDQSIARTKGGLGLGLSMAKQILEMHGGCVTATSKGLGLGSEFTIQIPLNCGQHQARATPGKSIPRRVLIVEDNVDSAQMLQILLQSEGHVVTVAYTAETGLNAAHESNPEIVLCDIGLPGGMDGYAFARAFRADPKFCHGRLVALSGYGLPSDQERAMVAGFDIHLTKPIDPSALLKMISSFTRSDVVYVN